MNTKTGCLVCEKDLEYGEIKELSCYYCGVKERAQVACVDGHYVCDKCHQSDSLDFLETYIKNSNKIDPIEMLIEVMKHPSYNMHGPEHHYIIPAIFLTAMKNSGIKITDNYWQLVLARCSDLPGGTCGYWGACAAALGSGIALSILKECAPLKKEFYGEIHGATANVLNVIAKVGGPRCCKRNVILTAEELASTLKNDFNIELKTTPYVCSFMKYNKECLHKNCPYFPKKDAA